MALTGAIADRVSYRPRPVFKRHDVGLSIKLRFLDACVLPVTAYSAESWTLTTDLEKKIKTRENR